MGCSRRKPSSKRASVSPSSRLFSTFILCLQIQNSTSHLALFCRLFTMSALPRAHTTKSFSYINFFDGFFNIYDLKLISQKGHRPPPTVFNLSVYSAHIKNSTQSETLFSYPKHLLNPPCLNLQYGITSVSNPPVSGKQSDIINLTTYIPGGSIFLYSEL